MKNVCLEEGLLQAYMDGELSPEATASAAAHLARCEACAAALASAAADNDFLSAALGPDEAVNVPTAHLRARLNEAVARLEAAPEPPRARRWNLGAMLAPLSGLFSLTPARAAAFASVLAAVAFAAVFLSVQKRATEEQSRPSAGQLASTGAAPAAGRPVAVVPSQTVNAPNPPAEDNGPVPVVNGGRAVKASFKAERAATPRRAGSEVKREAAPELLPGEKGYVEAIASLSKTVELGGDAVLRPAARADYERNLAVVDQAIAETRRVARQNPRDPEAVSFLLSAYQSKVDLLSTVAEQAQVATLGR
jgi:anti-sigma factor RsiW